MNSDSSVQAKHILNTVHMYVTREASMYIWELRPEGTDMDTWIQSEIYTSNKAGLTTNEQPTNQIDIIFERALNREINIDRGRVAHKPDHKSYKWQRLQTTISGTEDD
jgi:phage pi2 protein 07